MFGIATNRPPGWVENEGAVRPERGRRLYHFTSPERLPFILEQGILRGDVPLSPTTGFNSPWLTDDEGWSRQGWGWGSVEDKGAVRLTVLVPEDDPALIRWRDLATREGVEPRWYETLDRVAHRGSPHWWVYLGRIPPEWIVAVDHRGRKARHGAGKSRSR